MEDYIGAIKLFAGLQPPKGWQFCKGQLLQINANKALFSILGTTYGGDGQTTFALPNLQGLAPIGFGTSPTLGRINYGAKSGNESIPLTANNLPMHTHTLSGTVAMPCNTSSSVTNDPSEACPGPAVGNFYSTPGTSTGSMTTSGTVTISPAGGSGKANKYMPYLGMNYMICVQGYFPPRN